MRTLPAALFALALVGALSCGEADEDCEAEGGCGPFVCDTGFPETKYCTEIQALSAGAREVARSYCEPYHGTLVKRGCSRQGVIGACRGNVTHGDRGTTVRTRWYYQGYEAKTVDDVKVECDRMGEVFVAP